MSPSFDIAPADMSVIDRIVARAASDRPSINRMALAMDLTATHVNGCPLQLNNLLLADSFNFWHDIGGIQRHIDRETGQLLDCFSPRFAVR